MIKKWISIDKLVEKHNTLVDDTKATQEEKGKFM